VTSQHVSLDVRASINDSKYVCAGQERLSEHGQRFPSLITTSLNHMLGTSLAPRTRHHDCTQMMQHATLKLCLSTTRPYSGNAPSAVAFASIPRVPTRRTQIMPRGMRSQICDRREAMAVFTRSAFQPFSMSRPARPHC
jgi:hypothetical protein